MLRTLLEHVAGTCCDVVCTLVMATTNMACLQAGPSSRLQPNVTPSCPTATTSNTVTPSA